MRTIKRIVAWIVMILAVVGVIATLAGVIGSWVVRARVTEVTLDLLTVGEEVVAAGREVVASVDDQLDESHERINEFDIEVVELGEELRETDVLGSIIDELIGDDLAPIIAAIGDTAVFIRDNAAAVDRAIQAINGIPFLKIDRVNPEPTIFAKVANGITELEIAIEETRELARQERAQDAEELVTAVTDESGEWRDLLNDVQSSLAEADGELATSSQELAELKVSLPRTYTWITIGINLILLFTALAFGSLFFHGLTYSRDPDQSLRTLLLGD